MTVDCLAEISPEDREVRYTEEEVAQLHDFAMVGAVKQNFRVRTDQRSRNYGPVAMVSPPNGICLHHTAGTEESDLPILMGHTSRQVSSNDYITKQAVIYELVPHPRRSWAMGSNTKNDAKYWNDGNTNYWTIEIENRGTGSDPYPAIQVDAVVWRCRQLRKRWPNIKLPEQIFDHKDYQAGKVDMSSNFPLAEVRRRILAATDPTDDNVLPAPEPEYEPEARYTIISPGTEWAKKRADYFKAKFGSLVHVEEDAAEALKVSKFCDANEEHGEFVSIAMGAKAKPMLNPLARKNMERYGRNVSDTWNATTTEEAYASFARLVKLHGKPEMVEDYVRLFGGAQPIPTPAPPTPKPLPPQPGIDFGPYSEDSLARIHRFFDGINPDPWGIPYREEDGVMTARVADEVGMDLTMALAVVEQESYCRRVMGCDHGGAKTTPPYCNCEVTEERVHTLIGVSKNFPRGMNGIGQPQVTWWEFVLRAERLGGAHIPRNQLLVCLGDLTQMFGNYGVTEALGRYNAGSNWRNVVNTYVAKVLGRQRNWKARLAR